ncbi:MAG: single-stranded DNA-binding protein [Actinomycetota bacterium]
MSINTVTIAGNTTEAPELRYTPTGKAVAKVSIAVNRPGKGGKQVLDGFFKVVAWGKLAENIAETISKGQRVVVSGRLTQRSWTDGEDRKHYAVEIVAEEVSPSLLFGSGPDSTGEDPGESDANDEARLAAGIAHEPPAE